MYVVVQEDPHNPGIEDFPHLLSAFWIMLTKIYKKRNQYKT